VSARPTGAAITGERWRLRLADGRDVFVKTRTGAPDGFFGTEAAGLDWLGAAPGGPPVPAALGCDTDLLVLPWLVEEPPTSGAIERLGRELAALHAAGSPTFGAAQDGWIGAAELENRPADGWPEFYADRRVRPYVRQLRDGGQLTDDEATVFERLAARLPELAGPAEPPARIHGDLWTGNVLWSGGRGWLVDPAAHGGHRETDLAMVTLFGEGWVPRLLAAYAESTPLADGWRERQRLHQVHPLLVHAVLFGGGYLAAALAAAEHYL
jgi:fructosamine-3-kinase